MSTVIKVENLGKQYRLGEVGTGTVSHDLNRWWYKVRGKEDPYLKLGEVNDRAKKSEGDLVWALRDINFEVKQGEVLGIIGKNGAGKSTLLKILSRVTGPTVGDIKVKGRIASLLEVGTGFHPELTGRENIFINGAILGMTKQEIKSKFDEIVDFSGVERYVDTPVKRYSSGMYVRLAFAVAAHLEPEILIVDEVLAVGDAEFQNKCLGKMKDVSVQGRTVLFVSHNISSIQQLCTKCVLLSKGKMDSIGVTESIIANYAKEISGNKSNSLTNIKRSGLGEIKFSRIEVLPLNDGKIIKSGDGIKFVLYYDALAIDDSDTYEFLVGVWSTNGTPMFMISNSYLNQPIKLNKLSGSISFLIEKLTLGKGSYALYLNVKKNGVDMDAINDAYLFDVENSNYYNQNVFYPDWFSGIYTDFKILQ